MLGCRWIGLQVRTSRRHTGPTACPGICRQHPSPRHQFSRECGSVKKYFQEVDRSRSSVLMLEFLDFQVNVCPGQAGRIKAIEVTGRMTSKPEVIQTGCDGRGPRRGTFGEQEKGVW